VVASDEKRPVEHCIVMASRHALDLFDPAVAKQHEQMELRSKMGSNSGWTGRAYIDPQIRIDVAAKIADAMAKAGEKMRAREDERRRRDPTYREDAIDLSTANMKPFDKWIDYYARLGLDAFASALEIKKAHMKLALELHPDKQQQETSAEALEIVTTRFHEMVEAYSILSEPATRREYDKQRDEIDANNEAGVVNHVSDTKPPPTCETVRATLEQLYKGCYVEVQFMRNEFKGVRSPHHPLLAPPAPSAACAARTASSPIACASLSHTRVAAPATSADAAPQGDARRLPLDQNQPRRGGGHRLLVP
jgi:hypothetical protein